MFAYCFHTELELEEQHLRAKRQPPAELRDLLAEAVRNTSEPSRNNKIKNDDSAAH